MMHLTDRPAAQWALAAAITLLVSAGCARGPSTSAKAPAASGLTVTGPFAEGAAIPAKYTDDGADVSPALTWTGAPPATRSFALICEDPDAPSGVWVHWVLYDVPATATRLAENVPPEGEPPNGAKQGLNDFGRLGYGGPAPPAGPPHRYRFRLFALDTKLSLPFGATRQKLDAAMKGHVLAEGVLTGTYGRK